MTDSTSTKTVCAPLLLVEVWLPFCFLCMTSIAPSPPTSPRQIFKVSSTGFDIFSIRLILKTQYTSRHKRREAENPGRRPILQLKSNSASDYLICISYTYNSHLHRIMLRHRMQMYLKGKTYMAHAVLHYEGMGF